MDHLQSLGHILGKSAKRVHGFFRCAVANQVGIAVRDDYNIARRQLFFPATRQPGIRTAFRQRMRILADAEGLTVEGGPVRQVKWQELDGLTLRYYSTRRNRKDGWMTLGLKSAGRSLSIDSHIQGFDSLARQAAEAAVARGLPLDDTTRSNFAAMEVDLPPPAGMVEQAR